MAESALNDEVATRSFVVLYGECTAVQRDESVYEEIEYTKTHLEKQQDNGLEEEEEEEEKEWTGVHVHDIG